MYRPRSNGTINLLKSVITASPGAIDPAVAKSIEGEATFLRAHYHFEAWRMWGNIPYFRETDTDFRKPASTKAEVAKEIIKDLDAAIALLPASPRDKGRVGSWSAKAYKGRVQVYNGQFAEGLATLRDVQANGPFALEQAVEKRRLTGIWRPNEGDGCTVAQELAPPETGGKRFEGLLDSGDGGGDLGGCDDLDVVQLARGEVHPGFQQRY